MVNARALLLPEKSAIGSTITVPSSSVSPAVSAVSSSSASLAAVYAAAEDRNAYEHAALQCSRDGLVDRHHRVMDGMLRGEAERRMDSGTGHRHQIGSMALHHLLYHRSICNRAYGMRNYFERAYNDMDFASYGILDS